MNRTPNNSGNKKGLVVSLPEYLKERFDASKNPGVSTSPLIVRDLNGKIFYWNPSASDKYGWSPNDAVGNVSHLLLNTVFPQPLELINYELIQRGFWKGELIHTRSDGTRVKVSSRWELHRDANGELCTVLEINDDFAPLGPDSAYLGKSANWWRRFGVLLFIKKAYWLTPIAILLAAFLTFLALTPPQTRYPDHLGGANHIIFEEPSVSGR